MGALYTTVGLSLALLTHGAPYIPNKQAQMGASFLILLVTVLCYLNIKSTYQWKTGEEHRCVTGSCFLQIKTVHKCRRCWLAVATAAVPAGHSPRWFI